jgi:hypothetical protein
MPGDYDDSSSPCSQRLERYKHGFTEAVKKKFGRVEQIPQDHPLPMLFGLGEKFLRKISTSEEERGSHAEISQENIRKAAFEDTQFENESQSFGFFSHVLSLPECNQADVFKTGITLDALGALIKMQSLCAAACIMSMQGIRFPCVATSSDSLSSERPLQEASSCDKRPFSESSSSSISSSSSVLKEETGLGLRGRLFDGSDEKKELSEKAGDLVFQNPVLFFVKNAAASVTDALCKTKFWLPENTYTEKVITEP